MTTDLYGTSWNLPTRFGEAELRRRAGRIQEDGEFRKRLLKVHAATRKQFEPSPYVEDQIYEGFPSAADQGRMDEFQRSTWPARAALADYRRLRQLARRLLYLEHPEALDAAVKTEFDVAIAKRLLTTERLPWMTLPRAIGEADAMLDTLGGADADRVRELLEYLKARKIDAANVVERLSS